jgi:site-specific DNA-methyltransferase (adenine-specific)
MKHERKNSVVHLMDCIEGMKQYPDKWFDLAVVDPPYGIERFKKCSEADVRGATTTKSRRIAERFQRMETVNNNKPSDEYWGELFRVSKNQIIWGGNYFDLPPTRCYIFWDKMVQVENFADGELAWTSFDKNAKQFRYAWGGLSDGVLGRNKKEKSIHPTQKPVALYDWIFHNYAKPDFKILDSHLGSQSSRIAAHKHGLDFTGFELDAEYFEKGNKRFDDFISQTTIFDML